MGLAMCLWFIRKNCEELEARDEIRELGEN